MTALACSLLAENDIQIHFDLGKSAYRIGFFDPLPNAGQDIFIFEVKYGCHTETSSDALTSCSVNDYASNIRRAGTADHSLNSSELTARGEKIPKPRNMWIIYRQDKHASIQAENPGMHASKLCKASIPLFYSLRILIIPASIISKMWQQESPAIKEQYKRLAEEEKARHRQKYPSYKCSPRKSSEIKRRKSYSKYLDYHVNHSSDAAPEIEDLDGSNLNFDLGVCGTDTFDLGDSMNSIAQHYTLNTTAGEVNTIAPGTYTFQHL